MQYFDHFVRKNKHKNNNKAKHRPALTYVPTQAKSVDRIILSLHLRQYFFVINIGIGDGK
jgi:hypothetical protein